MGFTYIQKIPEPDEIKASIPLPAAARQVKARRDRALRAVLEGTSGRFIVVIGPCSAHDEEAVIEYVSRLARIQELTKDKLILVPRLYTNKPRTTGEGYKGMMHQPDHRKSPNIAQGISTIRKMHLRAIAESELTAADEMLYPTNHPYLDDVLSYVTVGARSVENQAHRLTASGLDIPAGMKNPTSGDIAVMLNSIMAAQLPHVFVYNGWEVQTDGNPHAHAILRGAVNQFGQNIPNYHFEDLTRLAQTYSERKIANPSIIVDTNHSNSNKQFDQQPRVALEVLHSRRHSPLLQKLVKGLMIESFIEEGTQKPGENVFGKSITDPCLGWKDSERLLKKIAELA
jgi:3-deoxy-7-phosphoheptulonate synthase